MYINKMPYKILYTYTVRVYIRFYFSKFVLLNEKYENLSPRSFGQWGGEGEVLNIRPSGLCSTRLLRPPVSLSLLRSLQL